MSAIKKDSSLAHLLSGIPCTGVTNSDEGDFSSLLVPHLTADSRQVASGTLFFALPGVGVDGHNFVDDAIGRGARIVVGLTGRLEQNAVQNPGVVFVEVDDTYKAYALASANYFDNPGEKVILAAVTGTNGKTTVTYIVEEILQKAGLSVGVVGTVNNRYTTSDGKTTFLATRFTTPEAFTLQQVLKTFVDHGIEYVIMEVSSHALAQSRVAGLSFKAAAFTNLSREHLDYHHGMDDYFQAKMGLFRDHLQDGATAVLPRGSGHAEIGEKLEQLSDYCGQADVSVINWGKDAGADIRILSHRSSLTKTTMELEIQGDHVSLETFLVGYYNLENILTAIGVSIALGVDRKYILAGITKTTGAPGRLQRITTEQWAAVGPTVFVDYAHTPDALEKVLATAKELPHSELYCVFGCGGDRDSGKRAVMGGIGARLCDVSIVTDDNPRTEDPDHIITQVLDGVHQVGCPVYSTQWLKERLAKDVGCVVVRDRHQAIEAAITNAKAGDIVVIAGKGHEPYQLTDQGRKYFDDRMQAKEALLLWTTDLVAEAASGKCVVGSEKISRLGRVITDSRLQTENGVFVALKGDNHDAHIYAEQAVENGARCVVVDRLVLGADSPATQIVVADTLVALGDLAAFRRSRLSKECEQTVIGLTGSCGKTTVKEMIAAILRRKYPEGEDYPANAVLKTEGNFNNLVGLPLSLLPLGVHTKVAVLEMGMNVAGEIKRLAEIVDPDISCITNIYGAHLLGLHSLEGVADAKEELFQGSKKSGVLIVNLDDKRVAARSKKYTQKKITFSIHSVVGGVTPDLWASDISLAGGKSITFTLHLAEEQQEIHLCIAGEHNVSNAVCAAATAVAAGCTLEQIVRGLADFRAPEKRMELLGSKFGFEILNDTYNANPASMEAGLKALSTTGRGRKIAVLGDMLELGKDAVKAHYEIGKCAAALELNLVICYGEWSGDIQRGMLENGAAATKVTIAPDKEAIEACLHELIEKESVGANDLVLFKASRGLRFETIVARFRS